MAWSKPRFELFYWPGIQGRGEFVRLPFEDAGIPYDDVGRLTTAPMLAGIFSEGFTMQCALTNASKDTVTARWQLIDLGGSVLLQSGPIVVASGQGIAGGGGVPRSAYCTFFVEAGGKGDVAAAIHVTDANGTTIAALPAQ